MLFYQAGKSRQFAYLASKNEAQQNGDGELAMAKKYDVEQIRVGGFLQEEPE